MSHLKVNNQKWEIVLFGCILVFATILRFNGLVSLPLAEDSLYTLRDSINLGFNIKPVYYFIQHLSLEVFAVTPFTLRLPAFLFGILGVIVTWVFVKKEFGGTAAFVATLMIAISPWHLYASQFARYWTLIYLLSVLFFAFLFQAIKYDNPKYYILAFFTTGIGVLTHMSFAFPIPGIFLGFLFIINKSKSYTFTLPSKNAWWYYWFPALLAMIFVVTAYFIKGNMSLGGGSNVTSNFNIDATLRVIPAMVQWMSPVVAAIAFLGSIFLIYGSKDSLVNKLGVFCLLGSGSLILILVVPGAMLRVVYADYGMTILPLIYTTIGVSVSVVCNKLTKNNTAIVAAIIILLAGVLPGTVSHMMDGTRFDYRPAFNFIKKNGKQHLVLGNPKDMQQFYAPELFFAELMMDTNFLDNKLKLFNNFWLISLHRRYGMIGDNNGNVQRWIDTNCRTVLRTQKQRIDYRLYRVELSWCGTSTY